MADANLKQQKTFATIRVVGGIIAATVLGFSSIYNVMEGKPVEGPVLFVALLTVAAFCYAGYYNWKLGKIAEQQAAQDAQDKS